MAYEYKKFESDLDGLKRYIPVLGLGFCFVLFASLSTFIVEPGHRGILITMGKVHTSFAPEGLGLKMPLVTTMIPVSVRQRTASMRSDCYSSDLQQVIVDLKILFRIPEGSVVKIYQEYAGDPFDSLVVPRINEAIKEVTALQSAEMIVKKREEIKTKSLSLIRQKIGDLLVIEDVIMQNISLSKELGHAIEAKMVQEQEAAKAKFIQQKAEIESNTEVIRAKGEAQSIQIRGKALRESPHLIQLKIIEKWDGKAPLVVGAASGSNIILPLDSLKK